MQYKITVDSHDDKYIYFWYDDLDGDAKIVDGEVRDAQINMSGIDLNPGVANEIEEYLQNWLDNLTSVGYY